MKAVIMFPGGEIPQSIEDFPEPIISNEDEILMTVKAAAVKHFDKSRAKGNHYSVSGDLSSAKVIGGDGVGILADGTRVFALGVRGTIAEKAIVEKRTVVKLPGELDDAIAAALPNAVAGSSMAMRFRAKMIAGETILINGATGFTGRIAVQIARYYGAGRIIVTGRDEKSLQSLKALGADEIVNTQQGDKSFIEKIRKIHSDSPVDIIIDYLWGGTAELILSALKGRGSFSARTRFVSIGAVTGSSIQLPSDILRSVNLQLSGSGIGSWTKDEMTKLFTEILPEMFQLASDKKLVVETIQVPLQNFEKLWDMQVAGGKRLVVTI